MKNIPVGNGLEAWRRLNREFGNGARVSEQSLLDKMMQWPKCSSMELVPTSLELFETVYKEYTDRTGTELGKGFRVA
eukprot:3384866-Karenia_brevis.AAC.1